MKQIWGLIIADPNEMHNSELELKKELRTDKFNSFHYDWEGIEIIVIESGIGLVNAAMMTQYLIDKFEVTKILNYGAVGGTNKVNLFDVIIPNRFYFHDVETPWYPRGQTPGEQEFYINTFNNKDKVNIASGNSFVYQEQHLKNIKSELDVDLFDMEACAIAQVCSKNKIPFFSVKGISDIIDDTDASSKKNINENIATSSKKALNKLLSLLSEIKAS